MSSRFYRQDASCGLCASFTRFGKFWSIGTLGYRKGKCCRGVTNGDAESSAGLDVAVQPAII
jgi:hypothetical protein